MITSAINNNKAVIHLNMARKVVEAFKAVNQYTIANEMTTIFFDSIGEDDFLMNLEHAVTQLDEIAQSTVFASVGAREQAAIVVNEAYKVTDKFLGK